MKFLQLLILLLVVPLVFHAQKTLTGLWIGSLSNDSTTMRKDQSFEVALTEYKGKVYGYSRSTFIVNDTLYYILKRVKGTIDGEICEVKDDEIVSYNFRGRIDKGIKVTTTFRRSQQDSAWYLAGDWKTNKTKKYYSISGKVELKEEADYSKSKIFPHLEELKIDNDVAFYAAAKKKETETNTMSFLTAARKEPGQSNFPDPVKTGAPGQDNHPTNNKATIIEASLASTVESQNPEQPAKQEKPEPTHEEALASASLKKSEAPVNNPSQEKKKIDMGSSRPEIKNQAAIKENKLVIEEETVKTETKKVDPSSLAKLEPGKKTITNDITKPSVDPLAAAAFVAQRKIAAPQILGFKSDSLVIKLYDNGEIDGDTVSVLLNGEILLARQGLKASAIKKTIYIQPGQDELNLVLYAENLGKYPPNTGLLVVDDGNETYQLRFSADLQQNAAIIFKRKK